MSERPNEQRRADGCGSAEGESLSRQKARLEIQEMARPWWQRPAYVAALMPTLLALCGLSWGFLSGYFQRENQLLELKKQNLVRDESDLKRSIADLKDRESQLLRERLAAQHEFEADRQRLTAERQALAEQLEEDKAAADKERQSLLVQMEVDKQKLAAERQTLATEIQNLEAQVTAMKQDLVVAPMSVRLSEFERLGDTVSARSSAVTSMIQLLRNDTRRRAEYLSLLKGALDEVGGAVQQMYLLYVLYKGTGDEVWSKQLLDLLKREGSYLHQECLRLLDEGEWPSQIQVDVLSLVVQDPDIGKCQPATAELFCKAICRFPEGRPRFAGFPDVDHYLKALRLVRNRTLVSLQVYSSLGLSGDDSVSINALAKLAPEAALVLIAVTAAKEDHSSFSMVRFAISRLLDSQEMKAPRSSIGFPDDLEHANSTTWNKWITQNKNLVERWLDPELLLLRQTLEQVADPRSPDK